MTRMDVKIRILNEDMRMVATYEVLFRRGWICPIVEDTSPRSLIDWLRNAPSEYVVVHAVYPQVSQEVVHFNRRDEMDLTKYVEDMESKGQPAEDVKTLFVGPSTGELPDDGVLSYVTAESLYDLKDVPNRSVVLFHPSKYAHLALAAENTKLLGLRLLALSGIPGMEYTADYDRVTWNLERVAYHTLVNDIRVASEVEEALAAQNMSVHDREKAQFSRHDGSVKDMTKFDVAGSDPVSDEQVIA